MILELKLSEYEHNYQHHWKKAAGRGTIAALAIAIVFIVAAAASSIL